MLKNVPLAANPKRAMLITIKERWFHWLMENTLVRSTSYAREEKHSKKTALRIMDNHLAGLLFFIQCIACHRDKKNAGYLFDLVIIVMFRYKDEVLVAEGVAKGEDEFSPVFKLF